MRYVDPTDATDSVSSGVGTSSNRASSCAGNFPATVTTNDSLGGIIITDRDQDLDGTVIDSITVIITNNLTGETATLVLYETAPANGYFDVTELPTSTNAADSTIATDTLWLRPGDTWTVRYVDPNDATDSVSSPAGTSANRASPCTGTFPGSVFIGDTIYRIIITDLAALRELAGVA